LAKLDWTPLITYIIIIIFTPGPNNITAALQGVNYGFRKTVPFCMGVAAGVFSVHALSALVSTALLNLIPKIEIYLRIGGALYILWLAYHTLRSAYAFKENSIQPLGFLNGFILQYMNIKALLFSITLFSTFLQPLSGNPISIIAAILVLSLLAIASTSLYSLAGSGIRRFLDIPGMRKTINIIFFLLLVYTALEISGILDVLRN